MSNRPLHPWDETKREGVKLKPAHVYAAERDWPGYFAVMANTPPRPSLLEALRRFDQEFAASPPSPQASSPGPQSPLPHAIDLGCGEGRDTVELLRRGWSVTAIDGHPEAFERLTSRPDLPHPDRLTTRIATFEHPSLPPARFVNAAYALPFCLPAHFPALWDHIVSALPSGGRFAGQFFGNLDDWAKLPDRTHHTHEQVMALLQPFEVELFEEEQRDSTNSQQHPKHWHIFHVVARKR